VRLKDIMRKKGMIGQKGQNKNLRTELKEVEE
jgi:hypothetical protein